VFEVDLRAGELFKQGIKVRIQQQPFRVLALLLEHAGEVVTREDLRQAIWPAGTFVEFDVGLDAAIHKLRSALGDSAENPRLVETLPRRGYRLIAAVESVVAPEAPRRRGGVATIIASAVSLAAIAALWHPWNRHTANSVAVLYFSARDTADAYLADGLTEDVTSLLGSVANVQVKSPGVVRRAQSASPGDAPAIARALGVHYVLDGNVRRDGPRERVSIQ
jgi:DNA-binding winged helix-turn-helix (wHTH) protein